MEQLYSGKRWGYLIAGTVVLLFSGLIYGWSLFSRYFAELYPEWSLSQLSVTFTLSMTCFCLGGLLSGNLLRRTSAAVILRASALLSLAGFFGVSRMHNAGPSAGLVMLYLFYGVVASLGVGINFNAVLSTVGRWFPDKAGVSAGAMMMGFGCGALVLGSLATLLIEKAGLFSAFLILGIATAAVTLTSSFVIRPPETAAAAPGGADWAAQSGGGSNSVNDSTGWNSGDRRDMTSGEMLRNRSFWLFMAWVITVNVAGMMIISSAASIAVAAGAPAIVGMVVSVCNGLGRILLGAVFDAVGRLRTMGINLTLLLTAGILMTSGALKSSVILTILGLMVMGIEYGGNPTICSAFTKESFGEKYYSTNFAIVNCSVIPAAVIGPLLSSRLVDAAGGSYHTSFMVVIMCAVAAACIFAVMCRGEKRQQHI